jgi:hypothetical protein
MDVSAALVDAAREIIAETHPCGASRLETGKFCNVTVVLSKTVVP